MSSRLRIAIISYRSNPHCGGQGVYVRHLSRALHDLGHRVEVIAGPPDPLLCPGPRLRLLPTLDLYNPEDLFRTPRPDELKDPVSLMEWLGVCTMGYPEPLTFGMRARRYLKKRLHLFDIIHDNQSLSYDILNLSRRLPVCATIHHPMTVDRRLAVRSTRSFRKKLQHLRWYSFIGMQKFVARRLPHIITVSDASRKDISREFSIPAQRFTTIANGINTDLFRPLPHAQNDPAHLIVTSSADTPLKGLAHLIRAVGRVAAHRPVRLTVVGTAKKDGFIRKLIRRLDLEHHVHFTGRLSDTAFIEAYAQAGIAVVPSLYEGFGLPVGEAMACGLPVICTTGGALPEVAGDAALLVPPADADALADAVIRLMDNPRERRERAQAGYERILSRFTWENTARQTLSVYRKVIRDYR